MANPFRYQGPVAPDRLIDRAGELDALQRAAADRVAIRLAAPRRFGKTSLLDAHIAALRAVGHRAVRVDLSRVGTVADACDRLARAYRALPGEPGKAVERIAQRVGVSLGVTGVTVTYAPPRADHSLGPDQARALMSELLDLPGLLYRDDQGLTVVCLDEFQDLLTADATLDGLVRSVIQHHGEAAAYVYAGSAPSLMRELFADRERPLYGQARPLELPPLPFDETVRDVAAIFTADGLDGGDDVTTIVGFGGGHPQRTMLLAHHLYNLVDAGAPTATRARRALDLAVDETADAQQAVWDALSRVERAVALALADGQPPTGARVAADHRLSRSTLQTALDRLASAEQHVVRDTAGPRLLDPLLAEWLRRR